MKPWQKGIQLDYLKKLEGIFSSYNDYCNHELTKFKKNNIADQLSKDNLMTIGEVLIHYNISKVSGPISMFRGVEIAKKEKGDVIIQKFGLTDTEKNREILVETLNTADEFMHNSCFMYIHEESELDKHIANKANFKKIGVKFNSVADIIGVYYREKPSVLAERQFPKVNEEELYNILPVKRNFIKITDALKKQLEEMDIKYENHYSNYNKGKSWSAISLRGYTDDPTFITKPIEMNKKWTEAHKFFSFEIQDTEMRKEFPLVESILDNFNTEIHRVRFMRLKPGGGELERHTDQVDPDIGISDKKLMRIHVPIKTNDKVEFTSWNANGEKTVVNMKEGECWYLDIRKPHTAINNGDSERIHLVIDVEANDFIRDMINAPVS